MANFVAEFEFERETKHTFRFKEIGKPENEQIGTLYVRKHALGGKAPQKLTATIAWEPEATAEAQA